MSDTPFYRLIHGDCLEEMPKLEPGSVDLVLVDPPYGITQCKWDSVVDLPKMWENLNRLAKIDAAMVLMANQPFTSSLIMSNAKYFKYCWYWKKHIITNFANAKHQPLRQVEDICVFYRSAVTYNPQGLVAVKKPLKENKSGRTHETHGSGLDKVYFKKFTNYPRNILEFNSTNVIIDKEKAANQGYKIENHPTQKPVDLMEYLVLTYTGPGDIVLDFTMGSGTTGVACKQTGRSFIGIEKDEKWFRVAQERINGTGYQEKKEAVQRSLFDIGG